MHWLEEGGLGMCVLAWSLALGATWSPREGGETAALAVLASIVATTTAFAAYVVRSVEVHAPTCMDGISAAGRATMIARGMDEASHLLVFGAFAGILPGLIGAVALAASVSRARGPRTARDP